ncbi:MAG: PhnD/SsuA/transferrin family substrate-binding protein [Thiolinea sp.]
MATLNLVSCLGENTYPISELLAKYLSAEINSEVQFSTDTCWQQACTEQLPQGIIKLGWLCGLLYTLQQDAQTTPCYRLLGSPVFSGQTAPVYYSYLIVRRDSDLHCLADLQGSRLVINEPGSYSGNHALWAYLAGLAHPPQFADIQISGRHSASMQHVADGQADVALIDHTVFDYWQQTGVSLQAMPTEQFRIITRLGPAPAPPLVAHYSLPDELYTATREALLQLPHPALAAKFQALGLTAIKPATDHDYDVLRTAYRQSQHFIATHYPDFNRR